MKHLVISLLLSFFAYNAFSTNVQIDTISGNLLHYKIYNDQGIVLEDAYWQNGKNVGLFKRYYENGTLAQEFFFDAQGKRIGEQKYYFENGQERLIGNWNEGKIDGSLVWYDEKGEVASVVRFRDGKRYTKF